MDVSARALIRLDGKDALDLLQRISTNHLAALRPGEHGVTVLTTEKGRIVDVVSVFRSGEESFFLAGQSTDQSRLANWISKFIVMEEITVTPLQNGWFQFLLFDLKASDIMFQYKYNSVLTAEVKYPTANIRLLIGERKDQSFVERILTSQGILTVSRDQWDRYRIGNAIPGYPNELNDTFNPLELGLKDFVSFTKGCYVGQEVIARIDTYDKLRKDLHVLSLSAMPAHVPIDLRGPGGEPAGVLTSYSSSGAPESPMAGLGVVRNDAMRLCLEYNTVEDGSQGNAIVLDKKAVVPVEADVTITKQQP